MSCSMNTTMAGLRWFLKMFVLLFWMKIALALEGLKGFDIIDVDLSILDSLRG